VRIATVYLLPKCDLACRFCGSDLGFNALDETEALRFVSFAATNGYSSVVLGGGEPLLWSGDLERVGAHARQLGLVVQLNTNGVAWRSELETTDAITRIILPLDGATAESHDFLRKPRGGHREIVEDRLARLAKSGKQTTVGSVICRPNLPELPQLAAELDQRVADGLNLHAWHLYRFRPIGRGGAIDGREDEFGLELDEFREHCQRIQSNQFPRAAEVVASPNLAGTAQPNPTAAAAERSWAIYRRPDMTQSRDVDFFWKDKGEWNASGRGAATDAIAGAISLDVECIPVRPASAPDRPLENV
jgi:MoaA/NifB/PqqE/SkfB family radical SAM enzyme